jgi:hypothetical protein
VGHRTDRKPAVKLSPLEASNGGCLRRTGICLTYTGEDLTGQRRERSTKKETRADETSRWQIRVKKKTGDARSIATLPGAAARAPRKQGRDVRSRYAATNVRTPFRQTRIATLKAAFAFGRQTSDMMRGNKRTNHRHATGAIVFFFRVGDDKRHDVRSGHPN